MLAICPNCEKERELETINRRETFQVRGEPIEVMVSLLRCTHCGEEFEDPKSPYDPLDVAYREYRRKHNMLQPEEIKDLRLKYGLTQGEMSKLLGWGGATLSRYENGALQDETHDKALRMSESPQTMLRLIEMAPNVLSRSKREKLVKELRSLGECQSTQWFFEERLAHREADELSGYLEFFVDKLLNAILFFCKGGIHKTKLNKLLFYGDFKHFKEYSVGITGARYVHLPLGPVPQHYPYFVAKLIDECKINVTEVHYDQDVGGEIYETIESPDLSLFSDSELKILIDVKERFKDFTCRQISDFSHDELGYKETKSGEAISYKYSEQLKI